MSDTSATPAESGALVHAVRAIVAEARVGAQRQLNLLLVRTNFAIGRRVVEHEQEGQARAEYGRRQLEQLSAALTAEFGRGYSVENLTLMRRFYLAYRDRDLISQTPSTISGASRPVARRKPDSRGQPSKRTLETARRRRRPDRAARRPLLGLPLDAGATQWQAAVARCDLFVPRPLSVLHVSVSPCLRGLRSLSIERLGADPSPPTLSRAVGDRMRPSCNSDTPLISFAIRVVAEVLQPSDLVEART